MKLNPEIIVEQRVPLANLQPTVVSPLGRRLEDTIAFPWQENDLMILDSWLHQMDANKVAEEFTAA